MGLCNSSANYRIVKSNGRRFCLISLLATPLPDTDLSGSEVDF